MKIHRLKTDPAVYDDVAAERKTFEIRFDDRAFEVGDMLILKKTRYTGAEMRAGKPLEYTGDECQRTITHVLRGPIYGLEEGWAILSVKPTASLPAAEDARDGWISVEERLPERHAPVALLDVRTFENVGGEWSRNLQAAGYLDDWNGSLERPHWSIRGQGSMCIDAYTHWMPLPAAPAMSQDSKGEWK